MTDLPISSPYRSTPDAPVTEAEREQLSSRLNTAYADGQLAAEDYQSRLDALFGAHKLGELVPVVNGLPPLATYDSPAMVASTGGQPGQVAESRNANGFTLVIVAAIAALVLLLVVLLLVLF